MMLPSGSIMRDALEKSPRYEAVDALRGLAMVIMALDHARFFLHRDVLLGVDPLDLASPESLGPFRWLGVVLHNVGAVNPAPGRVMVVTYPLVPWIGVMAAGYGFGALLLRGRDERRRLLLGLGLALTLAFIVIRA